MSFAFRTMLAALGLAATAAANAPPPPDPIPAIAPAAIQAVAGDYTLNVRGGDTSCPIVLGPMNRDAFGAGRDDFQVGSPLAVDCIRDGIPQLGGMPILWNVEKGGAIALYLDVEPRRQAALFLPARDTPGLYIADVDGTALILRAGGGAN